MEREAAQGKFKFDYLTAYVRGEEVGQVEPAVCLDESCYWTPPY
jgi:hypothetical protein